MKVRYTALVALVVLAALTLALLVYACSTVSQRDEYFLLPGPGSERAEPFPYP